MEVVVTGDFDGVVINIFHVRILLNNTKTLSLILMIKTHSTPIKCFKS